jgi:hypothetical protein
VMADHPQRPSSVLAFVQFLAPNRRAHIAEKVSNGVDGAPPILALRASMHQ